ncbi:MAG: GGDEF domain-containing protein [Solirubrobacteraceae bacterium]|nr:GGDEF domain-containing protein [Solirubrobacteraceae bacterium]
MEAIRLLYRDDAERERLLDMGDRMGQWQLIALSVLAIPAIVALPVYGATSICFVLLAAVFFALTNLPVVRRRAGDWAAFAAWVISQAALLCTVAFAEGPVVYVLIVPIFPMLLAACGFRRETAFAGAAVTIVSLSLVTLLTHHDEIAAVPPALWVPALLVVVMTLAAMALRDADMVNRDDVVVDELTGLLNRAALQARAAELAHQMATGQERVAIVVADVDHFKAINDEFGHGVGDDVLVGVAERLAEAAGATAVFRFGGEEFVALVEGADETVAHALAEKMRDVISARKIDGIRLTASFGVAATTPGEAFDYRRLFTAADTALYLAKAQGRDRTCVAGATTDAAVHELRGTVTPARDRTTEPAAADRADARRRDHREGNWLMRDAVERAHLVDITIRTMSYNKITSTLVLVAILSMVPWVGWELLVPVFASGLIVEVLTRITIERERPEWGFMSAFILLQIGAAVAVLVTGPEILFALPIFAIAMFGCGASLPVRGSAILVVTGATTMAAAALTVGGPEISANPTILVLPLALMVSLTIVGWAMGALVFELRVAAISDDLTGALNRAGLDARVPELTYRVAATGEPVAVLVADLDHFKQINDQLGHEGGDRVLAEVTGRMRSELRTFDSIYRIGGEEFVILLPGADMATAARVAERIRRAVARRPIAEVDVRVSLGVAGTPAGAPFAYDDVFAQADAALLRAKREGRDRVVLAEPGQVGTDEELLGLVG